jgi:hypothetical protein
VDAASRRPAIPHPTRRRFATFSHKGRIQVGARPCRRMQNANQQASRDVAASIVRRAAVDHRLARTTPRPSGFGSGAYSAKPLAGTRHRFSGLSQTRH